MVIYGKQIFLYTLQKHPAIIEEVFLSKEVDKKLFSEITALGKKIIRLDPKKAQALSRGGNHQGFLLKIKDFRFENLSTIKEFDFILILNSITDVGNIGSIIRSAYALGVEAVIIGGINSVKMETVVRSSSGAALDMPLLLYKDVKTLLNELKQVGFRIYGTDMKGMDVREIEKFPSKKALLLGSEGEGLPKSLLKKCDEVIKIEMERDFNSLNVGVAAAIFCDRMR
jgi:23S rRNA (guanosine2251-2'-O)-methyltransferase